MYYFCVCVNESWLTKTKPSFPSSPPSPRTDPNNKRMISIFRATLSPLLLLSSPKVRNADTRKSSGEDRHSANLYQQEFWVGCVRFPCPLWNTGWHYRDRLRWRIEDFRATFTHPPVRPSSKWAPRDTAVQATGSVSSGERSFWWSRIPPQLLRGKPGGSLSKERRAGRPALSGQLNTPAVAHDCRGGWETLGFRGGGTRLGTTLSAYPATSSAACNCGLLWGENTAFGMGTFFAACIPLTPRAISQPWSFTHLLFYPACH